MGKKFDSNFKIWHLESRIPRILQVRNSASDWISELNNPIKMTAIITFEWMHIILKPLDIRIKSYEYFSDFSACILAWLCVNLKQCFSTANLRVPGGKLQAELACKLFQYGLRTSQNPNSPPPPIFRLCMRRMQSFEISTQALSPILTLDRQRNFISNDRNEYVYTLHTTYEATLTLKWS